MTSAEIKKYAMSMGFTLTGVAPVGRSAEADFYPQWLERGYAGEMAYLERQKTSRMDSSLLMPDVQSVIVCGINYNVDRPRTIVDRARAWISRYAWGLDYHETLQSKLRVLAQWLENESGGRTRAYVDTGPVLERVFAKYAGIGWFGKNTCIINEKAGSWLFLGCILTNLNLEIDSPAPDRCGSCTRCIDACPTDAIIAPYVLDSRKCISYTTIELRGPIPEAERAGIGSHIFGCDICQDVCPWNRRAPCTSEPAFQPRDGLFAPEFEKLLELSDDEWRSRIRGTALKRAKIRGLLRNVAVAAGNSGLRRLIPKLEPLTRHEDEHVRSHALWAVRRLERDPSSVPE